MKQLTDLSLAGTKVTDKGMAMLSELAALESLSLRSTEVTDRGLDALRALIHLKSLNLEESKVTEKGVRAFQEAMPKVEVKALGIIFQATQKRPDFVQNGPMAIDPLIVPTQVELSAFQSFQGRIWGKKRGGKKRGHRRL
jgi:hypothetical protein